MQDSPVFIVGMPRSGTTLVRAALDRHSRIAVAPETHFLCQWRAQHHETELGTQASFDSFWERFTASRQFQQLELDAFLMRELILHAGVPSFYLIFRTLMYHYAEKHGKPRWGEKTPMHFNHLDELFAWFPNARVVFLLRDPRAVVASLMDAPWAEPDIVFQASRWRQSCRILDRWRRDPRVMTVPYERLVTQPEPVLRELCHFLDEPFEAVMLEGSGQALGGRQGGEWARRYFERAAQPIHAGSLEKWRERLSEEEVALIEYIARRGMRAHGYEMDTVGPGGVAWCLFNLKRGADRLRRLST